MSITVNGSNGLTFNDGSSQTTAATSGLVNRIINGNMVIDQRNAGASVTITANPQYTLDRWFAGVSVGSKISIQQNAGAVTPPAGFTKYLGVTSLAATTPASTDVYYLQQSIEGFNTADLGFGTANASAITISFWVRSSLTGTFGAVLLNAGSNRSYPFNYTISSANTWTQITQTISGDVTGTWATDNTTGFQLRFGLGAGATYQGTAGSWGTANVVTTTGAISVVGTNGATFYITGVDLRKGSTGATAQTYDWRPYGTELALCQRYYWQRNSEGTYGAIAAGQMNQTTAGRVALMYPVPMRTSPTVSITNIANTLVTQGGSDLAPSGILNNLPNSTGALLDLTVSGGTLGRGVVWAFNQPVSASVQASAEL